MEQDDNYNTEPFSGEWKHPSRSTYPRPKSQTGTEDVHTIAIVLLDLLYCFMSLKVSTGLSFFMGNTLCLSTNMDAKWKRQFHETIMWGCFNLNVIWPSRTRPFQSTLKSNGEERRSCSHKHNSSFFSLPSSPPRRNKYVYLSRSTSQWASFGTRWKL